MSLGKDIKKVMYMRTMMLCHYPLVSWPHIAYGGWSIHSHIHNVTNKEPEWPFIR